MMMRKERDSLGIVEVPSDAYFGAQTQRTLTHFPISGMRTHPEFIRAYALVKKAAARANMTCKKMDKKRGNAIISAASEVAKGKLLDHFVVDVFQAAGATSTNMNVNEVIANRAEELLGGRRGEYKKIHPNDHVNMSQSTNDTYSTATRVAAMIFLQKELLPSLKDLHTTLARKAKEFSTLSKRRRTHLHDATSLTLGEEFSGYSTALFHSIKSLEEQMEFLRELPLGGTEVGTGLNAPLGYSSAAIKELSRMTAIPFRKTGNFFTSLQSPRAELEVSGCLRTIAVMLNKISNDFILLACGPRRGLGELTFPAVQHGSSPIPGKVNSNICEMVNMVCYRIIGNDIGLTEAVRSGQLELNVYMPFISYHLIESAKLLAHAAETFNKKCVKSITPNKKRMQIHLEMNSMVASALSPLLGYEKTAKLISTSYKQGIPLRELVLREKLLPEKELDRILRTT